MITIDKSDSLYKYLTGLGVEDIDSVYTELAKEGRFKRADVMSYFSDCFAPSLTKEVEEKDLNLILDYFSDLKQVKTLNKTKLNALLREYHDNHETGVREQIINSQLKDVMFVCLNYKSLHENVDLTDLIQEANIGLMNAVEKYNPSARIDFKDYEIFYIYEQVKKLEEKNNG